MSQDEKPLTDRLRDPARVEALRRLPLQDASVRASFDRLSRLAAKLVDAPAAMVCIVEPDEHCFAGAYGLPPDFTTTRTHPSDYSYCDSVVRADAPFLVEDAFAVESLRGQRALTDLGLVSYAGVPIRTPSGIVLGALCAVDHVPRRWSDGDIDLLTDLAASVVAEIEVRSGLLDRAEEHYRRLVTTVPYGVYVLDAAGSFTELNPAAERILDRPAVSLLGQSFTTVIAPADLDETARTFSRMVSGEANDLVFETSVLLPSGEVRTLAITATAMRVDDQITGVHGIAEDITDRRRIEEALRDSEEHYRRMVHTAPYVVYALDLHGRFVELNRTSGIVLGLDPSQLIGRSITELVAPEDMPRALESMRRKHEGEIETTELEIHILRADGERRLVHLRSTPVIKNGAVVGTHGVARDITEERALELALRESEERLRQILGELPVGVVLTDPQGLIIWHNRESERIWGGIMHVRPSQYDVFRSWWPDNGEGLALDEMPLSRALHGENVSGGVVDIEAFDGERRTIINSAAPVRDAGGEIAGALWAHQDITHARALEAQRLTLASALEGLREGIALMTVEGEIQYANAAYIQMMGVDRASIPGLRLSSFAYNAGIVEEQRHNLRVAVETGRWQGRIWRRRLSDRQLVPFELILGRVDAPAGGRVMLFGIAQEISEQIDQERQLRRAERLGSLGTLIAGVAHELNNPLQAILNFSQLLLLETESSPIHPDIETIAREARRMAQIVGDLRQVARSTQDEMERGAVNLNELVRHVLHVQGYGLRTHNIDVDTELENDLPPVFGDSAQLEQVVLNLVVNAKQAMAAQAGRRHMTIRTRRSSQGAALYVMDNGPGILPEHMERIFDPFFTTKPPGEGTGLGLSLAHSIITEHGGEIRVQSTPGGGTMFRVDLPLAGMPAQTPDAPAADERPIAQLRVLIVDDEAAIRQVISRYLQRRGHDVDQAAEGAAALDLLDAGSYDVVVTDRRMPGMGGEALLDILRDRGLANRVIMLTGDPAGVGEHTVNGDVTVLLKPIELREVARAVERIGRVSVSGR